MGEITMDFQEEAGLPLLGERFPEMDVQTTQGMMRLPGCFKGRWFVLFSHPGDFTPVCTTEFVSFERLAPEFHKLNACLIGLSVDQVQPHLKWIQWIGQNLRTPITFPVIADPLGRAARRLGMISPYKGTNTVRAVFIVDPAGVIRLILYYPQEIGRNMCEILRAVQALQTADRCKAATPANWPNNELIGDRLIVPPASDVTQIRERTAMEQAGQIQCFDWWFCSTFPAPTRPAE